MPLAAAPPLFPLKNCQFSQARGKRNRGLHRFDADSNQERNGVYKSSLSNAANCLPRARNSSLVRAPSFVSNRFNDTGLSHISLPSHTSIRKCSSARRSQSRSKPASSSKSKIAAARRRLSSCESLGSSAKTSDALMSHQAARSKVNFNSRMQPACGERHRWFKPRGRERERTSQP